MNVIVYPYNFSNIYISEYRELFKHHIVKYLAAGGVLPEGFTKEQDVCTLEDIISNNSILNHVDALCIIDSQEGLEEELFKMITFFAQKGKNIIYAQNEYRDEVERICKAQKVKLIDSCEKEDYKIEDINKNSQILDIDTPIITIMGIGRNVQKYDLQLYLRKKFTDKGYKVSQIGTKQVSELFGIHSFPSFMFHKEYTDIEKIIACNRMVKKIEREEMPDIIIIGVPDSIMPLNNKHRFTFGMYAYEIYNAIHSDYSIVSLAANEYNDDFYAQICELAKYRYNIEIDAFYVSQFTPLSNSLWSEYLEYGYVPNVELKKSNYNIYNKETLRKNTLFENVEKRLLLYGRCEQF